MSSKGAEMAGEQPHVTEVTKRAGAFISAFEAATPEFPVSLDVLAESGDIATEAHSWLKAADLLQRRHEELFFAEDYEATFTRDFDAMLGLTLQIIDEKKRQTLLIRSAILGYAVLSFTEAGARLALDPSLLQLDDAQNATWDISNKTGDLAHAAFRTSLANRIRGDVREMDIAALGPLGRLLEIHYSFWTNGIWESKGAAIRIPARIFAEKQKLIPRFPAKTLVYDFDSWEGRPGPERAWGRYVKKLQAFHKTLQGGEAEGLSLTPNTNDITPFIFDTLKAAVRKGCSAEAALRLAVRDSGKLGRLAERTKQGLLAVSDIRYESRDQDLELVIESNPATYNELPEKEAKKLRIRDEQGSTCPARNDVPINKGGEVHEKVCFLSKAIIERTGVPPPLLKELKGSVYLDPAGFITNYILLAIANNVPAIRLDSTA